MLNSGYHKSVAFLPNYYVIMNTTFSICPKGKPLSQWSQILTQMYNVRWWAGNFETLTYVCRSEVCNSTVFIISPPVYAYHTVCSTQLLLIAVRWFLCHIHVHCTCWNKHGLSWLHSTLVAVLDHVTKEHFTLSRRWNPLLILAEVFLSWFNKVKHFLPLK